MSGGHLLRLGVAGHGLDVGGLGGVLLSDGADSGANNVSLGGNMRLLGAVGNLRRALSDSVHISGVDG